MSELILVTGITGHSGRYFIERMCKERKNIEGMHFRAIVRESSDLHWIEESGLLIETVTGDLENEAFLDTVMQDVTAVLHIAGIFWSEKVVAAAVKAAVPRVIAVHTTGIYSKYKAASANYLAIDANVAEMVRGTKTSLTILRPTMIYGDVDDSNVCVFVKMTDRLPFIPTVNGARYALQPVHRKDLGYAYYDVLMQPQATDGKAYVLSGGAPILLRQMFEEIAKNLNKKARFVSVPYFLAIAGAWTIYGLTLGKKDLREKVQRLVEPRAYPHDAATHDFGYAPMSFPEGIVSEVIAYQKQKKTATAEK